MQDWQIDMCKDNSLDAFAPLIEGVEKITAKLYLVYTQELEAIIAGNVMDLSRIEFLFDQIWVFIDDKRMQGLFWRLINYVETFDTSIGTYYRRLEELNFEGE